MWKAVGVLGGVVGLWFVSVLLFGTSESRLVCPGELDIASSNGERFFVPGTLYAEVESFGWPWFLLDPDSMIRWEVRATREETSSSDAGRAYFGGSDAYYVDFGYFEDIEISTPIRNYDATELLGMWSSMSQDIRVVLDEAGSQFSGRC
jgi:hypothetical protein